MRYKPEWTVCGLACGCVRSLSAMEVQRGTAGCGGRLQTDKANNLQPIIWTEVRQPWAKHRCRKCNEPQQKRIAVLFDGAGLARLGLERAGHHCTGFELNPVAHHLGQFVGSGNTFLADVQDVDLSGFDAVWASPPCQWHSSARTQGDPRSEFSTDLLAWSLALPHPVLWVENVLPQGQMPEWGTAWNAAQFDENPRQNRNRLVGGRYTAPAVYRPWQRWFPGVCPAITATEYKGCATDSRRASRFYGRRITIEEAAYHMGFDVPVEWATVPDWYDPDPMKFGHRLTRQRAWQYEQYQAIGNGVPVYMAKAFGEVYPASQQGRRTA